MQFFPIGILINVLAIVIGGIIGSLLGNRLSEEFKSKLNTVFGVCAMTMGISSIVLIQNMPAVILAVIAGTLIGMFIHLEQRLQRAGIAMQRVMSKLVPGDMTKDENYNSTMITAIVLFCASGTGIYGSITSGMTGDHSILLAKSILDLPTALIFACVLGAMTCLIALPQLVIFLTLFAIANLIYPLCTAVMINDFKACGGVLLLATGFRMMKLKECPIADMIPAMILVMPISSFWVNVILPLLAA